MHNSQSENAISTNHYKIPPESRYIILTSKSVIGNSKLQKLKDKLKFGPKVNH
ncbi:hypothetical protein PTUN_a2721 [Pseudoalteromonas tunicata]|nr:hypothetical protein PTUN_a2721 [Pseudoalteromonas tunicata]